MDNSSFPKIFDFKNKLLPDKQLLNLKTWFAKYDYTVQHTKGDKNLIPDFLTRPSIKERTLNMIDDSQGGSSSSLVIQSFYSLKILSNTESYS